MSKATYTCQSCKQLFEARTADRARGWARFCSKSCKAIKQEARTGQNRAYHQSLQDRPYDGFYEGGLCFPSHADEDIQ